MDPNALSFFSSITIHGLASSTTSDDSQSLVLSRDRSFPPKRLRWSCNEDCLTETDSEWESLRVPIGKAHAEFELLEQIGEGRISIVYAARLLCIRQCPNGDILASDTMLYPLPDQFCVKLAKAEFIRSLAREAWFYEQLAKEDGYQGVITPLCFGFFTAMLPKTLEIGAWSKMEFIPHKKDYELVYDRYYDDDHDYEAMYTSDQRTCRDNCPWTLNQWIARGNSCPIVGVLITEKLDQDFPQDFPPGCQELSQETQQEIIEILDDLSAAGIMHCDVKFNNFLRPATSSSFTSSTPLPTPSPSSSLSLSSSSSVSQICPRHNRIHPWRIIDFDRASKWGKTMQEDVMNFTKTQIFNFEYSPFWGGKF